MAVRKLPSGSWQGSYRDAAGKRHTKTWPTRTAAKQWAADGEAQVRSGQHRDPRAGRITLAEWHARWTAARVVEDATRRRDRTYAPVVLDRFGAYPLLSITRMDVQAWVREMEQSGRGPTAIKFAWQQLVSVLEAAVTDDLLPDNRARRVVLPRSSKQPDRILSFEEEDALLEALPHDQDRAMCVLMLDAGLRYGEVAGLHAHRVDMLRRELHVVEVLTQLGQIKTYPKSRRSRRTIPLEERALLALAAQMERWGTDGLVFRNLRRSPGKTTHGPIGEPNWRQRAWYPAVEKIADPKPTPHDLRHTCLSRLVADGVDVRTVRDFAGHESIQTTERYMHATPEASERVRDALRRARNVAHLAHEADSAASGERPASR